MAEVKATEEKNVNTRRNVILEHCFGREENWKQPEEGKNQDGSSVIPYRHDIPKTTINKGTFAVKDIQ